jgi:hypothetical protein
MEMMKYEALHDRDQLSKKEKTSQVFTRREDGGFVQARATAMANSRPVLEASSRISKKREMWSKEGMAFRTGNVPGWAGRYG